MFWNLCDGKVDKTVILNWLLEQKVVYAASWFLKMARSLKNRRKVWKTEEEFEKQKKRMFEKQKKRMSKRPVTHFT